MILSQFLEEAINRFSCFADSDIENIVISIDAWHTLASENSEFFNICWNKNDPQTDIHGYFKGVPIKIDKYNKHTDYISIMSEITWHCYYSIRNILFNELNDNPWMCEEYTFHDNHLSLQLIGRYKLPNVTEFDNNSMPEITDAELMSLLNYNA